MRSSRAPLVFSIASYDAFAADLCRRGNFESGGIAREVFPDGERYLRVDTAVAGRDVVVVGGTVTDGDVLELYDLCCAIAKNGAGRLTLVIPYFGYSTMERATRPGEVVTAKARARLLSSIPAAATGNRVLLLDLHSEGIPYYFEGHVTAYHVYAKPIVTAAIRRVGGDDFVLACTDAGRAKWVQSLANDLDVPASFVFKRRVSGTETEVATVSAHVDGKTVVIYDDMIRTGSSLVTAAEAYRETGARSLAAVTTHGVFPGDALERIRRSGLFTQIVCTDSHPRAPELAGDFLTVEPAAGLFIPHLTETPKE